AYSGGADSAFLAEMSHRVLGPRFLAVTADTPSLPRRELEDAIRLARARGWRHRVVATNEIEDERYAANPLDRCYFCKSALFDRLAPLARRLRAPILLGTNLDDLGDWRPGQAAADERGARHPLVEAGLTKAEIRQASRALGLPTADKPAAACMASRFAYGVRVTGEGLARVERAEESLLRRGFPVVRVRDLGEDRARVEVAAEDLSRLIPISGEVCEELSRLGFVKVTIDEEGYRRGALNEGMSLTVRSPAGRGLA
ncbi:MAG: ATP-dependent sacrificial sulfur transferase LarE, partial [Actinomycetota bacterium]